MAGLFDIGSSGIQAYRKALSVTGQNIANLNTEGYRRREASMEEISATQGDILSVSDQAGLGVRVSDISRAFDSFIASRARDTASDFSRADAYKSALDTLETVVLPEDYDLTSSINDFFDGVSAIAQAPGDLSGRVVALEQGRSLASAFQSLAQSLARFQSAVVDEVQSNVVALNTELQGLADVQAELISSGGSGKASNALMDQRDKSVSAIAEYAGVSVDYNVRGDARITLGATGNGPVLVEGKSATTLSVSLKEGQLDVSVGTGVGEAPTQQLVSGELAGLISAYETISQTANELDALARKVASDFNSVHSQGITLDGKPGGNLFELTSYDLTPDVNNLGSFTSYVAPVGELPEVDFNLDLSYQKQSGLWLGSLPDGTIVASGSTGFIYEGVEVTISGQPADGDELQLSVSQGKAGNMQFQLTQAADFAAAGRLIASADVKNESSAELTALSSLPYQESGLPALTGLLNNDAGVAAASRLLSDGFAGIIPASMESIELFSLGTQDNVTFNVTDEQQVQLKSLSVTIGGTTHSFDTSSYISRLTTETDVDFAEMAEMLNSGTITSSNGKHFAELGLFAAGEGGTLSIAASGAQGALTSASLHGSAEIRGSISAANDIGSQIQVFTREGRHVAGSPMSDVDAIQYLTQANGFAASAEYRADYLNGIAEGGFQGMGVSQQSPQGAEVVRFFGSGFTPSFTTGDHFEVTVPTPAQTISLKIGNDTATSLEVPEGVMADYIASQINQLRGDLGITARAATRVELSSIPDGTVSLELTSHNTSPVTIDAVVSGGSLSDFAEVINAHTGETGVRAEVSVSLQRLVLVNDTGADIVLGNVTTSGAALNASPVGAAGQLLTDGPALLGGSGDAYGRFGGEITLTANAAFNLAVAGTSKDSRSTAFEQGFISREISKAGSKQLLGFDATEGIDGNEARPDGSLASAAAAQFSLSLETDGSANTLDASVATSELADLSSRSIAAALAEKLRAASPVPLLEGKTFTSANDLPKDGDSISLSLGSQTYTLTMSDGEVVVSGPEEGRLSAGFDDNHRLVVSAAGGIETGQMLRVASSASDASRAVFGLGEADLKQSLTGRAFDSAGLITSPTVMRFALGDEEHSISITNVDGVVSVDDPGALPAGLTVGLLGPSGGPYQLQILQDGSVIDNDLRPLPSDGARALGFSVSPNQVTVTSDGLEIISQDGSAVDAQANASSLIKERLSLTNLPAEELIVILTGDGARRLSGQFSEGPSFDSEEVQRPLEVVVSDAQSGRIEIIDGASGHSIASRYLDQSGRIEVAGLELLIDGEVSTGDRFTLSANAQADGDGRNIEKLLALQSLDRNSGRGGFSASYSELITNMGAKVKAGTIAAASSEAVRDAAAELEAEFSGVNLDTEAARLLEQQQAYQALARVLSTAQELLDTLLNSI